MRVLIPTTKTTMRRNAGCGRGQRLTQRAALVQSKKGASLAKRFTETTKWQKEWYRKLGPKLRDLRSYLLDACDHAGLLDIDLGTISHFVGWEVSYDDIDAALCNRGVWHGVTSRKLFIPDFIEFQYGDASNKFQAKLSAFKKLKSLGLLDGYTAPKEIEGDSCRTVPDSPGSVPDTLSIIISNGISIKGDARGKEKKPDPDSLEALLVSLPKETKAVWDKLYPADFVDREILRAWGYYQGDKKPKRLAGWSKAFSSWLERSWKWENEKGKSGNPSDSFCGVASDV